MQVRPVKRPVVQVWPMKRPVVQEFGAEMIARDLQMMAERAKQTPKSS